MIFNVINIRRLMTLKLYLIFWKSFIEGMLCRLFTKVIIKYAESMFEIHY